MIIYPKKMAPFVVGPPVQDSSRLSQTEPLKTAEFVTQEAVTYLFGGTSSQIFEVL
jgi:hypothetical protein